MLVVGSRLRSNETLKYELKLPQPLYRIDADATASTVAAMPPIASSAATRHSTLDRPRRAAGRARLRVDPAFAADLREAHDQAVHALRDGLGPYAELVRRVAGRAAGRNFNWVRDVTVSNSTWGNRELRVFEPRAGVHAPAAASVTACRWRSAPRSARPPTASGRKTVCLAGDGGFILNLGELATLVQEQCRLA